MIHCEQKDRNDIKCSGCICYLECPPSFYDNGPTITIEERMREEGYNAFMRGERKKEAPLHE